MSETETEAPRRRPRAEPDPTPAPGEEQWSSIASFSTYAALEDWPPEGEFPEPGPMVVQTLGRPE